MNQAAKILMQLTEISNRDDRTRALKQLSGQNEDLQREVEGLLAAMEAMGDFLESPAIFGREAMEILFPELDGLEDVEGRSFIPLGPIGEGGMGSVWLARQTKPLERLVAVKLVKSGLNSQTAISRFESERQLLARLQHPNIATILDAGLLKRGSPFFVMEFVNGPPITEFAAANQLTAGECLRLMISVCRAIEHAHGRGIIHRDIKPGNVLVTLIDGIAIPKVIDFGIARAIFAEISDDAGSEKLRAMTGTPAYTAPELWGGDRGRISECSDVYALGVLLRELLLQTLPGSQSTSTDRPGDASAARETTTETRSTPVTESGVFPETLQTIINLATHSNPDLRYRSAKQLADALAEYLPQAAIVPVTPADIRWRPDWIPLLAVAVCSLLIWGGWMLSGRPWSIGEQGGLPRPLGEDAAAVPDALPQAADIDVARSALMSVLAVRRGDFDEKLSIDPQVLQRLQEFWSPLASLSGTSVSQRLLRAEARAALGMLLMVSEDLQGAATTLQQALGELRSLLSDARVAAATRPYLAETLRSLAVVRYCQGAREEGRFWFQESISFSETSRSNTAPAEAGLSEAWLSQIFADNLLQLGYCEEAAGEYLLAAEQLLQGSRRPTLSPAVLPILFASTYGRAAALAGTGRRSSAVSIACRATELGGLMRAVSPTSAEVDAVVAEACLLAGRLLAEAGRTEESLELLQRGGDLIQGAVPTESESGSKLRNRMAVAQELANVAERRQQPEQALFMLMSLQEEWRLFWLRGPRSMSDVAAGVRLLQQLGDVAGRLQRYPLAIAAYQETVEVCAHGDPWNPAPLYFAEQQAGSRLKIGEIRFAIGDAREAARELELARTGYLTLLADVPNDPQFRRRLARCWYRLGQTQLKSGGQSTTALNSLQEAMEIYEPLLLESPGDIELRLEAASCLFAGGESLLAERKFVSSSEWFKRCAKMLAAGLRLNPQELRFSELLTKTLYGLSKAESQDRALLDKP
jgi:serine/threonine protein kinase